MLPAAHALLVELDAEAAITRRVLDRVPADRYGWTPHPKSLTAGQLAQHIATIPANVARILETDGMDVTQRGLHYASCDSQASLLAALDASVAAAREALGKLEEDHARAPWRITAGDREIVAFPRLGAIRTVALNHWYHHRGELVVYLRLMDVPVPIVYGRSADESPLAQPGA
ncbi:MAG TPA: DinB family protein [Vicinamibacterales bacterium]|jgi:uncharacterized damage-inducible protein DinB